jgi:hypothetical protein
MFWGAAGFSVISTNNLRLVEDAFKQGGFWLVIIGHSIPPKRKKRIWAEIVNRCPKIEILDLYDRFAPDLLDADYYLDAQLGVTAISKKIKQIQRGKGAAVV